MASDRDSRPMQPVDRGSSALRGGDRAPEIRRARADEGPAIRDIRVRCLTESPEAFAATLDETLGRPQDHWVARAEDGASGDDAAIMVAAQPDGATDPGRWVGVVMGYRETEPEVTGSGGVISLVSMWTDPAARGLGVGRSLVQALLDWATGTDAEMVELWVMQDNTGAQKLYKAMGFAMSSTPRTDPGEVCRDEFCMQLNISRGPELKK